MNSVSVFLCPVSCKNYYNLKKVLGSRSICSVCFKALMRVDNCHMQNGLDVLREFYKDDNIPTIDADLIQYYEGNLKNDNFNKVTDETELKFLSQSMIREFVINFVFSKPHCTKKKLIERA